MTTSTKAVPPADAAADTHVLKEIERRVLLDLTREAPEAARRVVTVSPDVSSSTNLGGWVNKVGVWAGS